LFAEARGVKFIWDIEKQKQVILFLESSAKTLLSSKSCLNKLFVFSEVPLFVIEKPLIQS